jgi:surface protein
MRSLFEFLSTDVKQQYIIHATNDTIKKIVKDELDKLGHDADLNHIDVSKVTNMYSLFSCHQDDLGPTYNDLNPDISEWDVSKVIDMQFMFEGCKNFNQDISQWNVSKVEYMSSMFKYCEKFNQDLSKWNIQNVKYHYSMFYKCPIKKEWKPKFK